MSVLPRGEDDSYRVAYARAVEQRDKFERVLLAAAASLAEARPYVYNVAADRSLSPWRIETAEGVLRRLVDALERAEAML